jgi:dihydroneopterin aldolase/2-amino-4-hydroxy-6-hydroxymethyldihydropteridine diphosphokinase
VHRFLPTEQPTEIALRGLRVRGFHGVLPEERRDGQDFLVDVTLTVGTPPDDDLTNTADYGTLAQRLAADVARDPVDLIETLAQRLLDTCLATPLVQAATVRVHKPSAPIPLPFDDVVVTASRRRTSATVLSLGSNLGDRLAHLQAAVTLLAATTGVLAVSGVYETDPVGGPEQESFLNAAVLTMASDPVALLRLTSAIEASRQRERTVRWGPRTLDVDLVAVGDVTRATPALVLPHPRAHERAFVLVPWLAADPDAVLPGHGRVAELVAALTEEQRSEVRPAEARLRVP